MGSSSSHEEIKDNRSDYEKENKSYKYPNIREGEREKVRRYVAVSCRMSVVLVVTSVVIAVAACPTNWLPTPLCVPHSTLAHQLRLTHPFHPPYHACCPDCTEKREHASVTAD